MLGAAAIAPPVLTRRALAKPVFDCLSVHARRGIGRSAAGRRRAVDASRAEAARGRRHADGGGRRRVGDCRAIDRFSSIVQKGMALARPELGHSVHVEVIGPRAGSRLLVPLPRRRRGEPDRAHAHRAARRGAPSIASASPCAAAATTNRATSPRSGASPTSSSISSSTPATTSTKGAPTAAAAIAVRQHNGQEIYTLVDYRNRYALYKSDRDLHGGARLGAVRRLTWDDHEVRQQLRRRLRRERHAARDVRAAARRGVSGLLRVDAAARGALPSGSHMRIYRRLQFGNLIDLNVLDTRQWRTDQACGDGSHSELRRGAGARRGR